MENIPLYSGMIVKNYMEYVNLHHPEVDIDSILDYSGITRYQIDDQGHWFSQQQVDLFQEALIQKTGDPNIARKVGRQVNTSRAWGVMKQIMLGFITPVTAYMMIEKLYPRLSRACDTHVKKLKGNKVEVVVTPKPNVEEKPYQCENRWGTFEGMIKPFTKKLATVEHPTCIHKGGDCCRYIVTWEKSQAFMWRQIRSYTIPVGIILFFMLFFTLFTLPRTYWLISMLSYTLLLAVVSFYSEYREKKELVLDIESQGYLASSLLSQTDINYNNALLVQ
ncbi:MAG: AraC family transcriptional regulator ligand-binding domain-containing protein, partial [Thermodesulfobacteriota bacterium]|nr:AraC family transcriptional regulator ligand-binding domain-containing protein [Thermodesulfobacteriota bacterium]